MDEDHTLVCIPYEQNELKHEQNNNNKLFSIGNINKEIITEDGRQKCLLTVDVIPRSEGEETITVKASLPNKDVNIEWPEVDCEILTSEKDQKWQSLKEFEESEIWK